MYELLNSFPCIVLFFPIVRVHVQAFIEQLIEHLEPQIYSPGDRIIQAGDIGTEMYFIRRGNGKSTNKTESQKKKIPIEPIVNMVFVYS
jgi:hypothetical protein